MTELLLLCHRPEEFDQKSFLLTFYLSSLRLLAGYQNRVNLLGVHALGKWASCLVHICTVHVSQPAFHESPTTKVAFKQSLLQAI